MRDKKNLIQLLGQMLLLVIAVVTGGGVMCATVAPTAGTASNDGSSTDNGTTVQGDMSVTNAEGVADPEFYQKSVDRAIVKIRPISVPVDTLARHVAKTTPVDAMKCKYYVAGTPAIKTKLKTAEAGTATGARTLDITAARTFSKKDTILVQGVNGYKSDGSTVDPSRNLMLWVQSINDSGMPVCIAINGKKNESSGLNETIPAITANTQLIRMGKACAERDIQAPPYAIVPKSSENYCQKYMAQVEQTTIDKLSAKEVDWNIKDQEEITLYDLRMSIETSQLFGVKSEFNEPSTGDKVWTTEGIYWNAGKDVTIGTNGVITPSQLVDFNKAIYTGVGAGSKQKVLFAGSGLLAAFEKVKTQEHYVQAMQQVEKWDLKFYSWATTFGETLIIHEELFDLYGMANDGLIIDPQYLEKKVFKPFGRLELDLKKSGQSDSNAIVLSEISCLCLKNPAAHARVSLNTGE